MTLKFLIVDDSKAMQTIIKRILSNAGYQNSLFKYADNGKQALEHIIEWQPDMVLLDWHMPEMTGIELLRKVKELELDTQIGLVTAERNEFLIQEALSIGAKFIVNKPFTVNSLREKLVPALSAPPENPLLEMRNEIILPSPTTLSLVFSTISSTTIKITKVAPIKIDEFTLPFTVALYGDSTKKIKAVQILDSQVVDRLSESFAKSVFKDEPYDDKLLAKSLIKALSIISACFHNTVDSQELQLIKTYELQKTINKVTQLDKIPDDKRIDLCFTFESDEECHSIICLEDSV